MVPVIRCPQVGLSVHLQCMEVRTKMQATDKEHGNNVLWGEYSGEGVIGWTGSHHPLQSRYAWRGPCIHSITQSLPCTAGAWGEDSGAEY